MKKVSSLMILLLAGVMMFVSCSYAGNSGNGGGGYSDPTDISFDGKTFKLTGSVQLMTTAATVDGSDEYNHNYTGAFPKGRTVTLSPFIMGKYEVTQELYEAVMTGQTVTVDSEQKALSANPSYCTSTSNDYKNMLSGEEQKYRPVEGVTWYDACYFCNALSERMGLTKAYNITVTTVNSNGNITEATEEQFKQYFSGATTINYSSYENEDLDNAGWYLYNISSGKTSSSNPSSGTAGYGTHQVGKKPKSNAAGLYDMSGNVWEWCYDLYATISTDAVTNPSGPSEAQSIRVERGGGWSSSAYDCAVSYRFNLTPDARSLNLGFRVVRSAK